MTSHKEECVQRAAAVLLGARDAWQRAGAKPAPRLGFRQIKGFTQEDAEVAIRAIVDWFMAAAQDHTEVKARLKALLEAIEGLSGEGRSDEAIQQLEFIRVEMESEGSPMAEYVRCPGGMHLAIPRLREIVLRAYNKRWDKERKTGTTGPAQWGRLGKTKPTAMEALCSSLWLLHCDWAGEPTPPRSHESGKLKGKAARKDGAWEEMVALCLEAVGLGGGMDGLRRRGTLKKVHLKHGGKPGDHWKQAKARP